MRRIIFAVSFLMSCLFAEAQMARWVMQPVYDSIYVASGIPAVIADSSGVTSVWNMNERRVIVTSDRLHAFREGLAVTTKKETDEITGFYKENGEFVPLSGYSVAYSYPYFSDGYLLVKKNGYFCYLDTKGANANIAPQTKMYPFNGKRAVFMTYKSPERMKDPYCICVDTGNKPVNFSFKGKTIDTEDIKYLSSLNDEGIGIAVVKRKVYFYEQDSLRLEPACVDKTEGSKKKQIQLDGNIDEALLDMGDSIVIKARSGKNDVSFVCDRLNRLRRIQFEGNSAVFKDEDQVKLDYETDLEAVKSGDRLFGLNCGGRTVLPPQFENVEFFLGNYAVVCTGGKIGMLVVDKDASFRIQMNKGNDVAFRHQKFETVVRLDLPVKFSSDKCRFDISPEDGCEIDKTSIQTRNTESGNFVQYNCILTMPDSLPDVTTEVVYPVRMTYDKLKYPVCPLKIRAWHYKYINVDLHEEEITIEHGNVEFTVNISAEKNPGESDYPFVVEIKTDSLQTSLEKISETRYKCRIFALEEGLNDVVINILEKGCPPTVFPFEIMYVKPKKNEEEQVTIQKRIDVEPSVIQEGKLLEAVQDTIAVGLPAEADSVRQE